MNYCTIEFHFHFHNKIIAAMVVYCVRNDNEFSLEKSFRLQSNNENANDFNFVIFVLW